MTRLTGEIGDSPNGILLRRVVRMAHRMVEDDRLKVAPDDHPPKDSIHKLIGSNLRADVEPVALEDKVPVAERRR